MKTVITAIALRTVKYSDRTSILSVYSARQGRMSLAVPAGTGRSAARMRALLMPMAVFEGTADLRPGREISPVSDVRAITLPAANNPMASIVAMFLADLLQGLLREPMVDEALFACLADTSERLFRADCATLSNFHIAFIIRLLHFIGIEPDWSTYLPGSYFDMTGGIFRLFRPTHPHFLPPAEADAAYNLRRISLQNCRRFHYTRFERNLLTDRLIAYLRFHFPTLPQPASLQVLRSL